MIKLSVKNNKLANSGLLIPKNTLNPKIWNDMEIDPEVQSQLKAIAEDILKNIEIPAKIQDITITGSTASYNWHRLSDIDLHILLDFKEIDENFELVKRMLDQTRINWNKKHNIFIRGHEVELYFQDINEPHKANGIWSIMKEEWLKKPTKNNIDLDLDTAEKKAESIVKGIDHAIEAFEEGNNIDAYQYASKIKKKIANMRSAGLSKEGVYSPENLAFKMLRNSNYLEKLSNIKNTSYDRMMSIQETYIKDYFNSNKDSEHMEFEGKYDLEDLLDPDGPAPWGETEDDV
jgi:predicted nucleotidyltransferase